MEKKVIHELLAEDRGVLSTFLTLFSDPKKVITQSELYTKPWKYATYVATVSCLVTWFVIHNFGSETDEASFWLLPKRMLELNTSYQNYYENTQPLKRLIFGAIGFYVSLMIFFYKKRNEHGHIKTSLYLYGHTVFILFLLQTFSFMTNAPPNVGVFFTTLTMAVYLFYSVTRAFDERLSSVILRGVGALLVTFTIYSGCSFFFTPFVYYKILHSRQQLFQLRSETNINYYEEPTSAPEVNRISDTFKKEVKLDSLTIVVESIHSSQKEISATWIRCLSKSRELWSSQIFVKTNRYSPDPRGIFLRVDSLSHVAFACYRISNDSNSSIQVLAFDMHTGKPMFTTSVQPHADDVHIKDVAIDESSIYLCGTVQSKFEQRDLGLLVRIDKQSGRIVAEKFLGSPSYGSFSSFEQIDLQPQKISLLMNRQHRWMFAFSRSSWSRWAIDKSEI
jgi:hypothetical protein